MIRIGIDPGKNGYICVYEDLEDEKGWSYFYTYYPIPLIGDKVDLISLDSIFDTYTLKFGYINVHCVIEDVHALFGSAAKATFNFGWIVGVLEAMLVAHAIPYTKVTPKDWQKEMWQGIPKITKQGKTSTDTKAMSLLAAKRLFPNEDLRATERCTKPHDGKVDALLLAEYCRRKF
jgi:hypothetical protein